jgi:ferredoxin/flavodoxin---NADP+ reductase
MGGIMSEWIKGVVTANTHWTENLFSLQIDADLQNFVAGQYTSLGLDIGADCKAQPYSILSRPQQRPCEFFLYTNLDGELSAQLARLNSGDELWIKARPEGLFTLEQVAPSDELWLLATGTGVAPFLSMLQTAEIWQRYQHVVLVYAVRTLSDLCYTSLIDTLQKTKPQQFSFVPFVSREVCPDTIHGHIPEAISSGDLERFANRQLHSGKSQIMLCGNPGMVKDANTALKLRGFVENRNNRSGQITFESYW